MFEKNPLLNFELFFDRGQPQTRERSATRQATKPYQTLSKSRFLRAMSGVIQELSRKDVVTFQHLVDLTQLEVLRKNFANEGQSKPSYSAIVVKAASLALSEFPEANRLILRGPFGKRLVQLHETHTAVAVEKGRLGPEELVMTGIMHDTDRRSLESIHQQLSDFANSEIKNVPMWRDFMNLLKFAPPFLAHTILGLPRFSAKFWLKWRGGSIAVTSPAKYGVDWVVAKWPYPLTFAFGLVKERPVVVDGVVLAQSTLPLTLVWDRELMRGATAARFFARVVEILENAIEITKSESESKCEVSEKHGKVGEAVCINAHEFFF